MHNKRGFTLIELLVVISIIAILAVLVVTNLSGTRIKARNSAAKSDVTEMGKSIELYKSDDTNNSAERVIVPVATTAGSTSQATLVGNTETNAFKSIFQGGSGGNGAAAPFFYSVAMLKTPGNNHTYTYIAEAATTTASPRLREGACYVIGTSVDDAGSITDGYLVVKNGTAYNGDTVAIPDYTTATLVCNEVE